MDSMKILLISPRYHPHIGGVEYVVKSIAERLAKMGHEVTVLAGEPRVEKPIEEELNRVHIIKWPTWAPANAYHIPKSKASFGKLLQELGKDCDVVHVHNAHAILPVYGGTKLKRCYPNLRLVFTLHYHGTGHAPTRELLWKLYWRRNIAKLIELANVIHSVSGHEAEKIVSHYPHAKYKLVIIPNGVDEDVFQYRWRGQNSNYMMYAGRIERYKNLEKTIDLAKKLKLEVLIIGLGPHLKKLMNYADKTYKNKVKFLSPQPRNKYLELLSRARYAVNLSEKEAYSIFIAEALAMSAPAIVSKTLFKAWASYCSNAFENLDSYVTIMGCIDAKNLGWESIAKNYINKLYVV